MNKFPGDLRRFAQSTALITESGEHLSYESTADAADSFAGHLWERALVFLLVKNSVESVTGYLGCLQAKAPALLLAVNIHPEFLANLLNIYRPNFLWLPRERAGEAPQAQEQCAMGDYVLLSYCDEPPAVCGDLATLMTTSGSTGNPKLVRHSYTNLSANAASIARYLEIGGEDRAITSLPMNYVYGLSVINSHLLSGATVILTDASVMEKRFWQLFKEQKATAFAGVPYTYELLKRLRWQRMELPSLKAVTQAGGRLRPDLVHEYASDCQAKGVRFYVMYGAAEATARMSYLPPALALEKPSSIGVAIPGGEFWIEDENGKAITQAHVAGELIYRGQNVFLGYANTREDLARGDELGGVLHTGDIAKFDEDGAFYIVGRKNRFIKLFGNRVNLEDVEQLLNKEKLDCACAGNDDVLRIYLTDAAREREARMLVEQCTKLNHTAIETQVVPRIPRNEAGKILYAELP